MTPCQAKAPERKKHAKPDNEDRRVVDSKICKVAFWYCDMDISDRLLDYTCPYHYSRSTMQTWMEKVE